MSEDPAPTKAEQRKRRREEKKAIRKENHKRRKLERRAEAGGATAASTSALAGDVLTLDKSVLAETEVYISPVDGLRRAWPYPYTYETTVKKRWTGRRLLDVYCEEFVSFSPEYYRSAIASGRITVDGKQVPLDHVLRKGEKVQHRIHRHEPPVSGDDIVVTHFDEQLIVVNKPATIPVHAVGRFRHMSLVFLLARERGIFNLHGVHRLDRATSGLIIYARTPAAARTLADLLMSRTVEKRYIAKVTGRFPDGVVKVDQPVVCYSVRFAKFGCGPGGKPALTFFRRVGYDAAADTSLVECLPLTGRTHQIRVHLQWLGHPIANDARYGKLNNANAPAAAPSSASSLPPADSSSSSFSPAAAAASAASPTSLSRASSSSPAVAASTPGASSSSSSSSFPVVPTPSLPTYASPTEEGGADGTCAVPSPPPYAFDPLCKECADPSAFSLARRIDQEKQAKAEEKKEEAAAEAEKGHGKSASSASSLRESTRTFGHTRGVFEKEDFDAATFADAAQGVEDEGMLFLASFSYRHRPTAAVEEEKQEGMEGKEPSSSSPIDLRGPWHFTVPLPSWVGTEEERKALAVALLKEDPLEEAAAADAADGKADG